MARFDLTEQKRQVYRRYAGLALPRHTSYPIASVWRTDYRPADFRTDLAAADRPLSLYVHVPFCERLCYYCACTKEIIPPQRRHDGEPATGFLGALAREAEILAGLTAGRPVRHVHLGGGSPTFLDPAELTRLWETLRGNFPVAADAEVAIEIDPRITTFEHLATLRRLGFNRVSLGVQDFDPRVQRAVNRVQPADVVARVVDWCRALGFTSVNFDLIYGLPFQTVATMADTLDKTIALNPDRIAFYRLAVLPEMFRWQNVFRHTDLPAGDLPLELNLLAINRFLEAGYEFIGLDHFARPDEAVAQARRAGTLQRNFQGMTTGKGLDLIGLGPSAISQLDAAFAQNVRTSAAYREAVTDDLATERGLRLNADDRLRRELLQMLYGHGVVDKKALADRFGIVFDEYFADELHGLQELADDGLIEVSGGVIRLTEPLGRLLVRVPAAVFDRYLPPRAYRDGLPEQQASRVG